MGRKPFTVSESRVEDREELEYFVKEIENNHRRREVREVMEENEGLRRRVREVMEENDGLKTRLRELNG